MGTQKKIAEQITDGTGNYIFSLKANHERTPAAVINYVQEYQSNGSAGPRHQQLDDTPAKPAHGRRESRIYIEFEVSQDFPNRSL